MMSPVAVVISTALVLFAGHGLLRRLRFSCSSGPGWFGWSLLAGCTFLAALATLLSPLSLAHPWGLTAGLLVAGFILKRPHTSEVHGHWVDFGSAILVVGSVAWLAWSKPIWNPDALLRWGMHARWLVESNSLLPPAINSIEWAGSHPTYPPLLSAMGGLTIGLGGDPEVCLRLLSPIFLLALLGIVTGFCSRHCGRRNGVLLTLSLALTPCMSWLERTSRMGSEIETVGLGGAAFLADIPLALCLTAAAVLILEANLHPRERAQELCLGLACAAAVWCKQEGLPSILALLAVAAISLPQRRWLIRPSLIALAAFFLWRLVCWDMTVAEGENYLSVGGLGAIAGELERFPLILNGLSAEFGDVLRWGPLWFVTAVLIVTVLLGLVSNKITAWRPVICALLWISAGVGIAFAGFMATGWRDGNVELLMEVSLSRLLIHFAPCLTLALATALHLTSRNNLQVNNQ